MTIQIASVAFGCIGWFTLHAQAFQPSPLHLQRQHSSPFHRFDSSSNHASIRSPRQQQLSATQLPFDGTAPPHSSSNNGRRRGSGQSKDVVIVGNGLAGLSVALYLSEIDPDRHITILDREDGSQSQTSVGSFAAAGMLAPNSERLSKGNYLDLCMASKRMYPQFVDFVECMARESGDEGEPFLHAPSGTDGMEGWDVGYVASGGFLAPAFAGDSVATWAPPSQDGSAVWLDSYQVRELEPNVHQDVVGGWWFPEDASVDARRLTCSLRAACVGAGVQFLTGKNYEVTSLDLEEGQCRGLWLKNGKYMSANAVLVANGAWMRNLLPVPLEPHKGQSLSLRMPKDRPPILRRVLFAQDSYIVPKADGRIVIGATVEAGSFDPNVTPSGIMHILHHALQLVPGLGDLPLEETWAGLRPTTPDKAPIMGRTPWEGLFLAGGYWRNGVLLAPKTGELLASLIAGTELSEKDATFLDAFAWDRFTAKGGGAAMAANARYAASMYPIHQRKSGVGVAAAVGTELGSYSTARSANEERRKDRESLWDDSGDEAFERAASKGIEDATAFTGFATRGKGNSGSTVDDDATTKVDVTVEPKLPSKGAPSADLPALEENKDVPFTVSMADALTVSAAPAAPADTDEGTDDASSDDMFDGYQRIHEAAAKDDDIARTMREKRIKNRSDFFGSTLEGYSFTDDSTDEPPASEAAESDDTSDPELEGMYEKIRQNKASVSTELNPESSEERPDPGFRIYHVDRETGEERLVPPYTDPGEFLASIAAAKEKDSPAVSEAPTSVQEDTTPTNNIDEDGAKNDESYDETTLDGYQVIQSANSRVDRQAELQAMRDARKQNRMNNSVLGEDDLHM